MAPLVQNLLALWQLPLWIVLLAGVLWFVGERLPGIGQKWLAFLRDLRKFRNGD
jgi:Sec-independent protein translocase protein TatA